MSHAIGPIAFQALPAERRDTGALVFDGLLCEDHPGIEDHMAVDRAVDEALINAGWHAADWEVFYTIVEKPLFGLQNTVTAATTVRTVNARRAASEAIEAYPAVREAVEAAGAKEGEAARAGEAARVADVNGRARRRDRNWGSALRGASGGAGSSRSHTHQQYEEEDGDFISDHDDEAGQEDYSAFDEAPGVAAPPPLSPLSAKLREVAEGWADDDAEEEDYSCDESSSDEAAEAAAAAKEAKARVDRRNGVCPGNGDESDHEDDLGEDVDEVDEDDDESDETDDDEDDGNDFVVPDHTSSSEESEEGRRRHHRHRTSEPDSKRKRVMDAGSRGKRRRAIPSDDDDE